MGKNHLNKTRSQQHKDGGIEKKNLREERNNGRKKREKEISDRKKREREISERKKKKKKIVKEKNNYKNPKGNRHRT